MMENLIEPIFYFVMYKNGVYDKIKAQVVLEVWAEVKKGVLFKIDPVDIEILNPIRNQLSIEII